MIKSAKDPFAALRYAAFRNFIFSHFFFTVALLIQEIGLAYYLYDLTHDTLSLGLIGLSEAVPFILLALIGGYFADKFDRKKIYLVCFGLVILVSSILALTLNPKSVFYVAKNFHPYLIYTSTFTLGVARGFYNPAWSSLKPYLVSKEHYSNSASWSAQFWQSGRILGPVLGGFLFAFIGLINTLYIVVVLFSITLLIASFIPKIKINVTPKLPILQSIKEGLKFVKDTPIIFYALLLDMLSVLFGGVIAILPAFAKDILHVESQGLGILRAAPAAGAVITMFLTAFYPPTIKAWKNMLLAVLGFGLATLVFALSKNMYLSVFALFLTGAFDSISVVIRSTIMQIMPPENMRGRISSVNGVFVSTSNELGAFESGLAASVFGLVPSVIYGASLTVIIVFWIYRKTPKLLNINLLKEA